MSPDYYPPRRPAPTALPLLIATLLGAVIGISVYWCAGSVFGSKTPVLDPVAEPRPVVARTPFDAEETEAITLFKQAKGSVVNVDTLVTVRNNFDMTTEQKQAGTGSGFVWDEAGRIVTNFHVIQDAVANKLLLRVVLADHTMHEATIVGIAPQFDLAVLQIAPKQKLVPLAVGTSKELEVGQKVFAIGNPFGLSLTMTKGIISALDREIESRGDRPINGVIQIDAPINPGNSGGPLLDKDGRLIGVNTAIATGNGGGGNVGIGFAIPVDTVNMVVPELIKSGKILRPDLGVKLVDQRLARRFGFNNGVMIHTAVGPAETAGLHGIEATGRPGNYEPGDIILAVNGEKVLGNAEFARMIAKMNVGDTVTLKLERKGKPFEAEVKLRGI